MKSKQGRRDFLKKVAAGTAGVTFASSANAMSAKSYKRVIGANDRLNVAIMGLGRRLGAFVEPVSMKESNVRLAYLCDVMTNQRIKAAETFSEVLDYKPELENDIRVILDDPDVDAIINATPDHWHAPGTWMAVQAGKNVYVEKPATHNPYEGEILIECMEKYGKIIQMGNQQRSSAHTIEIINDIHNGVIGEPYKAVAYYNNCRGRVINPFVADPPEGLDWDLYQGPAPRKPYRHNTWDYNWHWYGWDYGTAETGNNATHELDVARWALRVIHPLKVQMEAAKRHFIDDGWTMYDTMDATFIYENGNVIKWDGKSRNSFNTYEGGRGTIIYGTEGTVHVDRGAYQLYDRCGKLVRENTSSGAEAGTALGGGGSMSTAHVLNFFNAIRGTEKQRSPIDEGVISTHLCHLANIASRLKMDLEVDPLTGKIYNRDAMKLWKREYEPGWEPDI
ncbi:MAG: Gfo/Idh/MocA family protein [bacterium]